MDFFKKLLMFLGVLWLLGFIMTFVLGYGVYSAITSPEVQAAVTDAQKEQERAKIARHNEQMNREAAYEASNYDSTSFDQPNE